MEGRNNLWANTSPFLCNLRFGRSWHVITWMFSRPDNNTWPVSFTLWSKPSSLIVLTTSFKSTSLLWSPIHVLKIRAGYKTQNVNKSMRPAMRPRSLTLNGTASLIRSTSCLLFRCLAFIPFSFPFALLVLLLQISCRTTACHFMHALPHKRGVCAVPGVQ